jgi:hypothetical protein
MKHKVATREEWLAARGELLAREKELTRRGDQLAAERGELPWVPIDKEYGFVPSGRISAGTSRRWRPAGTPGQLHTLLTAGSVTVHALNPVTSAAGLAHRRNACPGRHSVTSSPSPTDS